MKNLLHRLSPFLLVILLLSSCKQTFVQNDNTIEYLPKDWSDQAIDITDYIDDFEIISLETNPNSMVGLVTQIAKFGDNIVVLDRMSRRLLAFDFQGKFSHNIGNEGKGPGEYVNPAGFAITPDNSQIAVYVMQNRSLLYYSPQGEFLEEHKLVTRGYKIAFVNDTLIGLHTGRMGINGGSETYFDLWIMNKKGEIIDSLFNYKEALSQDRGSNFMPSFEDGYILYTRMADYNIYKLSFDKVDTLYRFDFGAANLDTSFYLRKENFDKIRTLADKVLGFSTVTNTKTDLLATFTIQGRDKLMILVNNQTANNKYIPIDSTGMGYYYGIPVPIARWADDTHRYSKIPAYLWKTFIDNLSSERKEICRNKIKGFQKSEEAMESDNPIIFRFKFKDF